VTLTRRSTLAEVAAAVAAALREAGFRAVLTGGACATIYSDNAYQSRDLDFIVQSGGTQRELEAALATLGFRRRGDRYVHPRSTFFVEFVRGPLAIGDDVAIRPVTLKVPGGTTLALSPTDACRDRLAAFYHWSDRQSLASAVEIARRHPVRMTVIRRWSEREGHADRFREFQAALREARRETPSSAPRGRPSRRKRPMSA
jgi:hypothetical protein